MSDDIIRLINSTTYDAIRKINDNDTSDKLNQNSKIQLFNKSATSIHSKLFDLLINLLIELPHQPT